MRYVAAYLLANLAGNENPDLKAIEKILSSVGIETDKDKANKVINELKGKSVQDLIKKGSEKLATVPSAPAAGGAAPAAAAAAAPGKISFILNNNSTIISICIVEYSFIIHNIR
jgi:large subunit ribosomal protein LP2